MLGHRRTWLAADHAVLAAVTPDHAGRTAGAVVSTVARGGAGWAATSVALAAAGGRYRRAGAEGMVAWLVGQTVAVSAKRATSRRRPPRQGGGPKTRTSSMPSSHTAAAVAYAVAAGSRAPALAAPLGAAAVAVGWSRLSTRKHFPTDVAVGAVVGIAAGTLTAVAARRLEDRSGDESLRATD